MTFDQKSIFKLSVLLLSISFISGLIVFLLEDGQNPAFSTFTNFLFWWVAILTTVGTGTQPVTDVGQFFAIITMLSGTFVYLALFSELILWIKSRSDQRFGGYKKYKGKSHILIVGYNELAVGLINLLDRVVNPEVDIVLVTSQIDTNPNADRVTFVKLNPAVGNILQKVNAQFASVAFVLSKDEISAKKIDLNTVLIANTIEKMGEHVFTYAELTHKQKKEFEMFEIDEFFTSEDLLKDLRTEPNKSKLMSKLPDKLKEVLLKS